MIHVDAGRETRSIVFRNGDKERFPLFNIGRESYINSMQIDTGIGNEVINVQIGSFCSIAYNVLLLVNRNHDYKSISTSTTPVLSSRWKIRQKGQVLIGNDVWIGNNTVILSGVTIGDGAVIGAGTVVSKDVPPYSIVVGNPQRVVKYRFGEEQIEKLLAIRWWNWDYSKIEENREWFAEDIDRFIDRFYPEAVETCIPSLKLQKRAEAFLFIPDFHEPYPIWQKVIKEYCERFSSKDDVTLILRIKPDENFNKHIEGIRKITEASDDEPDILVENSELTHEKCLFKEADYFITTRCRETLKYVEYAREYNVQIKSGVDIPVF